MRQIKVAIIGSGNIGTDLLLKLLRRQGVLEVAAFVGIDAQSEGLSLAAARGVPTTAGGIEGMISMPDFKQIQIVFDATSAQAHRRHHELLRPHGKRIIDLTPAAIGPYCIPPVNGEDHLEAPNVNMVTCGGQATIPIVAAISRITPVRYGEIVASIASRSAGPGTRANIDEFTETTSRAIESIGGAQRGKAIIVLNPAEPPLVMRDTVYCLTDHADEQEIAASIGAMVKQVQTYVPGYRQKQAVQFERMAGDSSVWIPEMRDRFEGLKITTFLEVEGAADYLPAYAGNLDIMTSAAVRTGERIAVHLRTRSAA